jgi:hypothetical protein
VRINRALSRLESYEDNGDPAGLAQLRDGLRDSPAAHRLEAAIALAFEKSWVLSKLREVMTDGEAHALWLRVTNEHPLAVCTGVGKSFGFGCYRVFEEVPRTTGGKPWPHLCPDCQKRNGKKNPQRDAVRRRKQKLKIIRTASAAIRARGYIDEQS